MPSREVRDPIHSLITFQPEEWKVIGTVPFQRLRGVQQLAMTYLVYPGARHSRFEHCLGAAYVAGRLAQGVDLDEPTQRRVRMAALVHDIGHGPFSHVSEEVFERRTGRRKIHEAVSAAILRHHQGVREAMGAATADWTAELLSETGHGARRSVERDIVAGPADADKLDYLLRDSHYCGVKYGEYDLAKVVESARRVSQKFGVETFLAFDKDGIYALEEMLLARYHMNRQVYGHKTRLATDRMLVRAVELAIDEKLLPADVFTPSPEPDASFVTEYVKWDDAMVIHALLAGGDSPAAKVMKALVARRLFKRVLDWDFSKLDEVFGTPDAGFIAEPTDQNVLRKCLPEAEGIIAKAIGVPAFWVSLHWVPLSSPISDRFSFKVEGKKILITDGDRRREFNEASEVFSPSELPGRLRVVLYARLPNDQSPTDLTNEEQERIENAMKDALTVVGQASGGS